MKRCETCGHEREPGPARDKMCWVCRRLRNSVLREFPPTKKEGDEDE